MIGERNSTGHKSCIDKWRPTERGKTLVYQFGRLIVVQIELLDKGEWWTLSDAVTMCRTRVGKTK